MKVERIKEGEEKETFLMIKKTCEKCFPAFYPEQFIKDTIESVNESVIKDRSKWCHFYVVKEDEKIIGCGAISSFWGSETESILLTIFVDPDFQKKGIGRRIMETLENDEYFKRAKRIEIPASMFALPFYKKMGYNHKNGVLNYNEGHFELEKFK